MTKLLIPLLFVLSFSCTNKPVVLPKGTVLCTIPYYGQDCMDNMNIMPKYSNGLPCNLCQQDGDGPRAGCAWKAQQIWCVQDCTQCSALNADFTKK